MMWPTHIDAEDRPTLADEARPAVSHGGGGQHYGPCPDCLVAPGCWHQETCPRAATGPWATFRAQVPA